MAATLAAVAFYPHVAVTVPSGHVGVLWKRFAGGTVNPSVLLEKTPAAGLAPPAEKIQSARSSTSSAADHEGARSFWPLNLSDIETYVSRTLDSEPKD